MWAYNYFEKDSHLRVPSFKLFLKHNHDLTRMWFEETYEEPEDRTSFLLRALKFKTMCCILFIFTFVMINPKDQQYQAECDKRLECQTGCSKDFFPSLACHDIDSTVIEYYGNTY